MTEAEPSQMKCLNHQWDFHNYCPQRLPKSYDCFFFVFRLASPTHVVLIHFHLNVSLSLHSIQA